MLGETKVNQFQRTVGAFIFEQKVFELEITVAVFQERREEIEKGEVPMNDPMVVEIQDCREHILKHSRGVNFCKTFFISSLTGELIK